MAGRDLRRGRTRALARSASGATGVERQGSARTEAGGARTSVDLGANPRNASPSTRLRCRTWRLTASRPSNATKAQQQGRHHHRAVSGTSPKAHRDHRSRVRPYPRARAPAAHRVRAELRCSSRRPNAARGPRGDHLGRERLVAVLARDGGSPFSIPGRLPSRGRDRRGPPRSARGARHRAWALHLGLLLSFVRDDSEHQARTYRILGRC